MPETETQVEQSQATSETQEQTPPWGTPEEFDAEKAWKLIEGLRADKEKLAGRPVLTDEQQRQLTEYQTLIEASKSDLERANESTTRWQTEAETWRGIAVGARIEALAADFADPSDAVTALAGNQYLDAGGQIDEARIKQDLADVLDKKPHWRKAQDATTRVPAPNQAQGASGAAASHDPAGVFAAVIQGQLNGR